MSRPRRHVTYANVAATLALVLSMTGGALAASHYLLNSTRQINPKVLKKLRGRSGARGAVGPEGPQGQLGPVGPRGIQGKTGPEGLSSLSPLPSGVSESGVFGLSPDNSEEAGTFAQTVPFALALKAALNAEHAIYLAAEGTNPHCAGPGQADGGYLCLYSTAASGIATSPEILDPEHAPLAAGAGQRGFVVRWTAEAKDASDYGTYTVTGP
jgi:hypothetical protein